MGYFSNGTEGMIFEDKNCLRCIHLGSPDGPGCPVMLASFIYNYDQMKEGQEKLKGLLEILMPTDEDGFCRRCAMFAEAVTDPPHLSE